jgi:hypothetical protein
MYVPAPYTLYFISYILYLRIPYILYQALQDERHPEDLAWLVHVATSGEIPILKRVEVLVTYNPLYTTHLSLVTCHLSLVTCHFLYLGLSLVTCLGSAW